MLCSRNICAGARFLYCLFKYFIAKICFASVLLILLLACAVGSVHSEPDSPNLTTFSNHLRYSTLILRIFYSSGVNFLLS